MKNVDVIHALLSRPQAGVLAVISAVEGPSYRPVGAMMAIFGENDYVGSLSSGCVEADIALHALASLNQGKPSSVRYGKGSPYLDIQLPCGGGLEIVLLPNPDLDTLREIELFEKKREKCTLCINLENGEMGLEPMGKTERVGSELRVELLPNICFYVFGKGPETSTFVSLAASAGYAVILLTPDEETLGLGQSIGCETRLLTNKRFPVDLEIDAYSAVTLFFHDHDWEPPILLGALKTSAFYIGAQGSLRARDTRLSAMIEMGASSQQLERLHGPVGTIPSARDPITLAVSVLAEIVGKAAAEKLV